MRTRQQLEDIIQRVVCELLPKMPPQDIRPAYQQQDMAGKDVLNDDTTHSYRGFTPDDNFIYITVNIGKGTVLSEVDASGNVRTGCGVTATFTLYGSQSAQLALCLFNLLKIPYAVDYLESYNLFLTNIADEIDEFHEIINEQWFERHEFDVSFIEPVNIRSPQYPNKASNSSVDIRVITNDDSGTNIIDTGVILSNVGK